MTLNISSSGVLLQASDPPPVDTPVAFRFTLAHADSKGKQGEVIGAGRVVRIAHEQDQPAFAVAIHDYDILPIE